MLNADTLKSHFHLDKVNLIMFAISMLILTSLRSEIFYRAKIDKSILNKIDTQKITENYTNMKYDSIAVCDNIVDLFFGDSNDDLQFDMTIYPDIKYKSEANLTYCSIKTDDEGKKYIDNNGYIRKNNIRITFSEKTTKWKSKQFQEQLIEILDEIGAYHK